MSRLSDQERKRYSRQIVLDEIGETGQLKLKTGRVLVVGTGGLGSAVLYYLAAAGIGTLGVVDSDTVDLSNLQRQILHSTEDLGQPKTVSAGEKLTRLNPDINIITVRDRLTAENAAEIIGGYHAVVDATDNFPARFIMNEACVRMGKPFIHGGILGFYGQTMTVLPGRGPCYNCVFRHSPPPEAVPPAPGVLGAVAGTIGTIQAAEAVKILLGAGRLLVGRLLTYNALEASFREVRVKQNPNCPVCSTVKKGSVP